MENTTPPTQKWYDKTWLVILWCILFYPVGLYGLWKNKSIGTEWKVWVSGLFGVILIVVIVRNNGNSTSTSSAVTEVRLTKEQKDSLALSKAQTDSLVKMEAAAQLVVEERAKRKELVEKQFSGWDGSHVGLTRYIKEHMNDPDTYEHMDTRFGDKGDYILVVTRFRGANAFGGKVINTITAKVDLEGNVIEIIE